MTRRVHLDNVEHARLRVSAPSTSDLSVNQALVVPIEFEELQREYAILFRKDSDGLFQSVALLGLDRGENLVMREGEWITRYIPATLRRGPFFLDVGEEQQPSDPAIVIDLDHPSVSEAEGEPLFLPQGGAAPFLQQATQALRTVHQGLELSRAMFDLFAEIDLIRPIAIEVNIGDGKQYRLPDFFTIDAERLGALSGPQLERLNRTCFLAAAIHARSSLGNITRLIELKTDKFAGAVDA